MNKIICPSCNSSDTCRILYGMPDLTDKLVKELESGRVHLGGCIVTDDDPDRHCNNCEVDFHTNTPNIYLDIDGVLLTSNLTPANHAKEFIHKVLEEYPYTTYWLTTHCQGDPNVPLQYIGRLFDSETVEIMKRIKPTSWNTAKTRAIDFSKPFLWFDDNLFIEEKQALFDHNAYDNLIQVDLVKKPDMLSEFIASFPRPIHLD